MSGYFKTWLALHSNINGYVARYPCSSFSSHCLCNPELVRIYHNIDSHLPEWFLSRLFWRSDSHQKSYSAGSIKNHKFINKKIHSTGSLARHAMRKGTGWCETCLGYKVGALGLFNLSVHSFPDTDWSLHSLSPRYPLSSCETFRHVIYNLSKP